MSKIKTEEKKVVVRIPLDREAKENGKAQPRATLIINGNHWSFERGIDVEVPEYVRNLLVETGQLD